MLVVPRGNTAENAALPRLALLTPQHPSLNSWRRRRPHAGCPTLCLLPLWLGGWSRTWGRTNSGEAARTAMPPTWVTAMDPSLRGTGYAREGTGSPEATQLSEEQDAVWNESQKGTRFPSWFSWTQLRYQGEATSLSPVTLLSDSRAHGGCQTIKGEKHGWEMLPISLLHSHQMLYRYYTNSFPSVGFACTCYSLIRRKLGFFCSHHKQRQYKHINLSLKFLFLLSEMPEDCPVNPVCNSLLHSMMNNVSSLYLPQMKIMPSEIHSLLHGPQIL